MAIIGDFFESCVFSEPPAAGFRPASTEPERFYKECSIQSKTRNKSNASEAFWYQQNYTVHCIDVIEFHDQQSSCMRSALIAPNFILIGVNTKNQPPSKSNTGRTAHNRVSNSHSTLFMVALCNRADHYIFILFLLSSSFFFFFSSPNLSGRKLDVYHTLAHDVALVRI